MFMYIYLLSDDISQCDNYNLLQITLITVPKSSSLNPILASVSKLPEA